MKRFLVHFFLTITIFCFSAPVIAAQDQETKITNLENKVSKKFSKTFCNSTGFGISSEGALRFSIGETKGEFSKNPLIEKVDIERVKEKILVDISDSCYFFDISKNDLDNLILEKNNQ